MIGQEQTLMHAALSEVGVVRDAGERRRPLTQHKELCKGYRPLTRWIATRTSPVSLPSAAMRAAR
jgi:hypothetical protein